MSSLSSDAPRGEAWPGQARARPGIALPLVRANQWTLVLSVLAAALLRAPTLLLVPWAITLAALLGGPRWHLVFRLTRRALAGRAGHSDRLAGAPREDAAVQRFNGMVSGTLLTLALIAFYLLHLPALAWVFAGVVAVAAFSATRGFCIGCHLYGHLPPAVRRLIVGGPGS